MARGKIKTRNVLARLTPKRSFIAIFAGIAVLAAMGCGSSESAANSSPGNVRSNAGAPQIATNAQANTMNGNVRTADAQMQRLEEMRQAANRAGKGAAPSPMSRPAPEDSVMTATLTDVARETRTWNKHPVLLKVEKTHDGEGSVKVYLRSGKTIDLPGNSIERLDQITAAAVLELAGVNPTGTTEGAGTRRPPKNK